jgi:hypothetical protein
MGTEIRREIPNTRIQAPKKPQTQMKADGRMMNDEVKGRRGFFCPLEHFQ